MMSYLLIYGWNEMSQKIKKKVISSLLIIISSLISFLYSHSILGSLVEWKENHNSWNLDFIFNPFNKLQYYKNLIIIKYRYNNQNLFSFSSHSIDGNHWIEKEKRKVWFHVSHFISNQIIHSSCFNSHEMLYRYNTSFWLIPFSFIHSQMKSRK